jgi:hypothetical protein
MKLNLLSLYVSFLVELRTYQHPCIVSFSQSFGGRGRATFFEYWSSVFIKKIGILTEEWEPHFIEYFIQTHSKNLSLNIYLPSVLILYSSTCVVPPSRSVFLKHPTEIVPIARSPQATSFRINTQLSVFSIRFSWGYSFFIEVSADTERVFCTLFMFLANDQFNALL